MNECCSMCIKEVMGKAKLTIKNSNDTTKLNCRCFHKNCETSLCISGTYASSCLGAPQWQYTGTVNVVENKLKRSFCC